MPRRPGAVTAKRPKRSVGAAQPLDGDGAAWRGEIGERVDAMSYKDEIQVTDEYVQRMGKPLGALFSALWRELVWLHVKWGEYVELFGTDLERVELLNRAAPNFFGIIQDVLLDNILLHIARMTDEPGSGTKTTLTIRALPDAVDPKIRATVEALINSAKDKVQFCRVLRNKSLAHSDLTLALDPKLAAPLPTKSRNRVREALDAVGNIMNTIEEHYGSAPTGFAYTIPALGGAGLLLDVIESGLAARKTQAPLSAASE
jgi:hypothetical protein